MNARAAALIFALLLTAAPARADGCDALTATLIRVTGASLAGRDGSLVVFRAADAERMSLDCGRPHQMLFRSRDREPSRFFFVLIGLAAKALAGARPEPVEDLALRLHQATLLSGSAQEGRAGPVQIRCEAGDRLDGFHEGALCRLVADRRSARRVQSSRRGHGVGGAIVSRHVQVPGANILRS